MKNQNNFPTASISQLDPSWTIKSEKDYKKQIKSLRTSKILKQGRSHTHLSTKTSTLRPSRVFQIDPSSTTFLSSNKLHHKYKKLESITVRIGVVRKYWVFNTQNTKAIFHHWLARKTRLKFSKFLNQRSPSKLKIHKLSQLF